MNDFILIPVILIVGMLIAVKSPEWALIFALATIGALALYKLITDFKKR